VWESYDAALLFWYEDAVGLKADSVCSIKLRRAFETHECVARSHR
jgi:hypothetical protein